MLSIHILFIRIDLARKSIFLRMDYDMRKHFTNPPCIILNRVYSMSISEYTKFAKKLEQLKILLISPAKIKKLFA